jgi:hypothetical protein
MDKKHMKDHKKLRDIGELNLIRGFRSQCSVTAPDVVLGIGDDAAAFRVKAGTGLVTSDMMIEGIHFDISLTTFYQLCFEKRTGAERNTDRFCLENDQPFRGKAGRRDLCNRCAG